MKVAPSSYQPLIIFLLLTSVAVGTAYWLSRNSASTALWLAVSLTIGLVAFLKTQIALLLLIAAMLLSPEFTIGITSGAALARGITLRLDDLLLLIIGVAWLIKSALYKELNLLKFTTLNKPALLYATTCILPTLIGMEDGRVMPATGSLFLLKYLEYFLVFWMVVNNVENEKQVKLFLVALIAVALIVGLVAIMQIPSGGRVSAPFEGKEGEPNTLGGYLLFIMALLLGISCASPKLRLMTLASLFALFVPFLYTLSRGSYLAFLPMVVAVLLLARKLSWLLLLIAALGIAVSFPWLLPQKVRHRIEYTFKQPPHKSQTVVFGYRLDTSTSARLDSFSIAFSDFQKKPLLGWGVTGWHFIDSQYIRTLIETGLVGLAAFSFLIFSVLRSAWKTILAFQDTEPLYFGLSCGFIGGTVGLLIHAIGANTFIIVRIMEPFWLACGLIYILPEIARRPEQTVLDGAPAA